MSAKSRCIRLIPAVCLTVISCLTMAQPGQYEIDGNTARDYAAAYSSQDLQSLSELLADNAVFSDPSNHYQGKEAIIEGFRTGFKKIIGTGPDSREIGKFRSGNEFVHIALLDFSMLMSPGGLPEAEYRFKVDFTMILKVENGKVVEHTDYVDTEAFVSQLQAQIAAAQTE